MPVPLKLVLECVTELCRVTAIFKARQCTVGAEPIDIQSEFARDGVLSRLSPRLSPTASPSLLLCVSSLCAGCFDAQTSLRLAGTLDRLSQSLEALAPASDPSSLESVRCFLFLLACISTGYRENLLDCAHTLIAHAMRQVLGPMKSGAREAVSDFEAESLVPQGHDETHAEPSLPFSSLMSLPHPVDVTGVAWAYSATPVVVTRVYAALFCALLVVEVKEFAADDAEQLLRHMDASGVRTVAISHLLSVPDLKQAANSLRLNFSSFVL
jgi:hypothetical protein